MRVGLFPIKESSFLFTPVPILLIVTLLSLGCFFDCSWPFSLSLTFEVVGLTMHFGFEWILVSLAAGLVNCIDVDLDSSSSLKDASSTVAYDMMKSYTGNNTGDNPGNLPPPYFWWEAGAMFMHMVDYYYC